MLAWSLWCRALPSALKSITLYLLIGHQRGLIILRLHKPDISSKHTSHLLAKIHPIWNISSVWIKIWGWVWCKESLNESSALAASGYHQWSCPFVLFDIRSIDRTCSLSVDEALLILPVRSLVKSFVVVDICDGTLITRFASGESVKNSSLRLNIPAITHTIRKNELFCGVTSCFFSRKARIGNTFVLSSFPFFSWHPTWTGSQLMANRQISG